MFNAGERSFPVSIPVTGGEILGLFTDTLLNSCLRATSDRLPIAYLGIDPAPGTTFFIDGTGDGFSLNESATLSTGPTAAGLGTAASPVLAPQSFSGAVGSAIGNELSVTIDWGDGTTSAGSVAPDGTVSGRHSFPATGA